MSWGTLVVSKVLLRWLFSYTVMGPGHGLAILSLKDSRGPFVFKTKFSEHSFI